MPTHMRLRRSCRCGSYARSSADHGRHAGLVRGRLMPSMNALSATAPKHSLFKHYVVAFPPVGLFVNRDAVVTRIAAGGRLSCTMVHSTLSRAVMPSLSTFSAPRNHGSNRRRRSGAERVGCIGRKCGDGEQCEEKRRNDFIPDECLTPQTRASRKAQGRRGS